MQYRRLGKTELNVSIISYGTISFDAGPDKKLSDETVAACLNRALDLGCNFIDTARAYGECEAMIGRAISGRRDEFYLCSKSTAMTYDEAMRDLEASLEALQTDYLDLWLAHSVSYGERWRRIMQPDGEYKALLQAKEEGMVRHIGASMHRDVHVMRELIASGAFEAILVAYNVVDGEYLEPEILPLAMQHDVGVFCMKPLAAGGLVMPAASRTAGLGGPDAVVAGCLRYVLGNPAVACAIPGMISVEQVEANMAIGNDYKPLSEQELDELRRLIGRLGLTFQYGERCLHCGYCLPCPQGINIPVVLRAAEMKRGYPDNVKYLADDLWESLGFSAVMCDECGECLSRCPRGVDIPAELREAEAAFAGA